MTENRLTGLPWDLMRQCPAPPPPLSPQATAMAGLRGSCPTAGPTPSGRNRKSKMRRDKENTEAYGPTPQKRELCRQKCTSRQNAPRQNSDDRSTVPRPHFRRSVMIIFARTRGKRPHFRDTPDDHLREDDHLGASDGHLCTKRGGTGPLACTRQMAIYGR
jgi:hypothetical protein